MRTANTGQYHGRITNHFNSEPPLDSLPYLSVGHGTIKALNGRAPGSSSTTATSVSLGGHGRGDTYRRTNGGGPNGYFHGSTNGNGAILESSTNSMMVSTMHAATPPLGNGRRPADGRGYNKSFWRNLQLHHYWLPLWGVQPLKGNRSADPKSVNFAARWQGYRVVCVKQILHHLIFHWIFRGM